MNRHPEWAEAYARRPAPGCEYCPAAGGGCGVCRSTAVARPVPAPPPPRGEWVSDGRVVLAGLLLLAFACGLAVGVWSVVVWLW